MINYKFAKKLKKTSNLLKLVLYIDHFFAAEIRLLLTIWFFLIQWRPVYVIHPAFEYNKSFAIDYFGRRMIDVTSANATASPRRPQKIRNASINPLDQQLILFSFWNAFRPEGGCSRIILFIRRACLEKEACWRPLPGAAIARGRHLHQLWRRRWNGQKAANTMSY